METTMQSVIEANAEALETTDYTALPDVEHYRVCSDSIGTVGYSSDAAWREAMEQLSAQFPQYGREDIALAVAMSYVARVSEDHHATVGVRDCRHEPKAPGFTPVALTLTEEMGFEKVLNQLVRGQIDATMREDLPVQLVPLVRNGALPLGVTLGEAEVRYNCEIELAVDNAGSVQWTVSSALNTKVAELMGERMTALAQGIAADAKGSLLRQPVMSARERKLVVQDWNATEADYPYEGGLVAMAEHCARANPDHPALVYAGETLSFSEFNARSNRLARKLREMGVGKDTFVALCMERSHELVIALWAVLKAGGAYVPLNTEDPSHRISEIIEDCRPVVVLTQEAIRERIETEVSPVMVIPTGADVERDRDASDLGVEIGFNDLAYMIYTSGSTGKPKGVVVEHGAIHNRVVWMQEEYQLTPQDRILQKTPYTFDVSVWEFLWSFAYGATLVVAEPGGHMAMGYMSRLINDEKVTYLHFVPSVMRLFLMVPGLDQSPIRKVFCSGEALPFDLVQSFFEKTGPKTELHNLYGPTEAAVDVSYFECKRDPASTVIPIGLPVTNTGLYVLDEFDQPVPVGVPGELHIGGVQLARGYWAREDLTAERFIPCPVEDAPHDRLYRTGDLAFFQPDGQIVYMGRNDFQVKINGVRMELGEIEAAIREQGGVHDVVVVAEENDGAKSLIAYVVADSPGEERGEELKQGVAATRPVYYVPKEIHFLSEMPLTVSGKINRKVLADQPRL